MSLSATLLPEFDNEMASTRRVLARVPDGKSDWRPHPKSTALGYLASHVAELPTWTTKAIRLDEFDIAPPGGPPPRVQVLPTTAAILAAFGRNVAEARAALAGASDEELHRTWTFKMTGKTFWAQPKYDAFRGFSINHLIHHRAQLGVYLRLLDVAVPAIYGPSADERVG